MWKRVSKSGIKLGQVRKREWGVPQYEGTIFSKDRKISLSGEELTKISVENEFMAPALRELLLSESEQFGKVPIDFRSLSVR